MPKLPSVKPRDTAKALEKVGFSFIRQKGSHRLYRRGSIGVIVPFYNKNLKKGTLRNIIRQSGLTVEGFLKLLKE